MWRSKGGRDSLAVLATNKGAYYIEFNTGWCPLYGESNDRLPGLIWGTIGWVMGVQNPSVQRMRGIWHLYFSGNYKWILTVVNRISIPSLWSTVPSNGVQFGVDLVEYSLYVCSNFRPGRLNWSIFHQQMQSNGTDMQSISSGIWSVALGLGPTSIEELLDHFELSIGCISVALLGNAGRILWYLTTEGN